MGLVEGVVELQKALVDALAQAVLDLARYPDDEPAHHVHGKDRHRGVQAGDQDQMR